MRKLVTNCPNCGGVLRAGNCPYCGTKVRYANELDIKGGSWGVMEIMLHIEREDGVLLLPIMGRMENINITHSPASYFADGTAEVYRAIQSYPEIEFTFRGIIQEV